MDIHPDSREQFEDQMRIHKAHLIMLTERGVLSEQDGGRIARALAAYDVTELPVSAEGFLTLSYVCVEKQLLRRAGEIAGNLHIARSNNDMGVTMARMSLRKRISRLRNALLTLADALIRFSEKHIDTLCIGYTHTQHGQPTTLAHYALAVLSGVFRDIDRLDAAYHNVNRCPMGAGAITTSGFPIDRARVAALLAFDEPVFNAYDAIAGADHVLECTFCLEISAISLGRVAQDLLTWHTEEFAAVSLPDDMTGGSSIMPQKRNSGALEHLRASLSRTAGETAGVAFSIHNTPFGDIGDIKVTPEASLWQSFDRMTQDVETLRRIFDSIRVDVPLLERRCRESLCTLTELADEMVRAGMLCFRTAHGICARLAKNARAEHKNATELHLEDLQAAAQAEIGRLLSMDEATFRAAIDPRLFVEKRICAGGPAHIEMLRMLEMERRHLSCLREQAECDQLRTEKADSDLNHLFEQLTHTEA